MTIKINPNKDHVQEVRDALAKNDGYCPCKIDKTPETKCMCKDFIDKIESGYNGPCECELYTVIQ